MLTADLRGEDILNDLAQADVAVELRSGRDAGVGRDLRPAGTAAATEAEAGAGADFVIGEAVERAAGEQLAVVAEQVVEGAVEARAEAVHLRVVAQFEQVRRVERGERRGDATIARLRAPVAFDVLRGALVLVVRAAHHGAELLRGAEALTGVGADVHQCTAAELIGAAGEGRVQQRLIGGRGARDDVDVAADGVSVHVRGERLGDLNLRGLVGRHDIHRQLAAVLLGRADTEAVQRHRVEISVGAADLHEASFALVAEHGYTRYAGERFGHVGVGKTAHEFVVDDTGDRGRRALLVECGGLSGDLSFHLHRGERGHRVGHLDVERGGGTGRHRDRLGDGLKADIAEGQRASTGRNVGRAIRAVLGGGTNRGALDGDEDAGERTTIGISDGARHHTLGAERGSGTQQAHGQTAKRQIHGDHQVGGRRFRTSRQS